MGEQINSDKALDSSVKTKAKDSDAARKEAEGGLKDLSSQEKSYRDARKGGLRDKSTQEHLGPQPELIDSSAAVNQNRLADHAEKAGDKPEKISSKPDKTGDKSEKTGDKSEKTGDKYGKTDKTPCIDLTSDANGNVTDIHRPDGTSASVKYDKENKPIEIKTEDGTWKKEKDGWDCYDKKNKKTDHLDGEMEVSKDGDITARQKGGYSETLGADGSVKVEDRYKYIPVVKDDDGKVTDVHYPNGKHTHVAYDDKNNPKEISAESGTWRKEKDGWNHYDCSNKKNDHFDGEFKVNENGDITAKQKGGYSETLSPDDKLTKEGFADGHKETITDRQTVVEDKNHNTVTTNTKDGSSVSQDKDGHVKSIKDANGKVTEFAYNENGQLGAIRNPDGTSLHRDINGKWNKQDRSGKPVADQDGNTGFEEYSVDKSGSVTKKSPDGKTEVKHLDNSKEVQFPGGGQMDYDKNGRLERIANRDGSSEHMFYDRKGELTGVQKWGPWRPTQDPERPDMPLLEKQYSKGPDGKWSWNYGGSDEYKSCGDLKVSSKGEIIETPHKDTHDNKSADVKKQAHNKNAAAEDEKNAKVIFGLPEKQEN